MPGRPVWEIIADEFRCDHPESEIRKKICSNGTIQWKRQCLQCGDSVGVSLKKDSIPLPQRYQAVEFDEHLREAWNERRQQRSDELANAHSEEWWDEYNTYLTSMGWRQKRDAVLKRDQWVCQGCRQRRAAHVHHLTYQRLRHEMLFDLISVCEECHGAIHRREESKASDDF